MAQKKAAPGGRFAELRAEVDDTPYVLTDEIKIRPMTREQLETYLELTRDPKSKPDDKWGAMLGDAWPAVKALFADQHHKVWEMFVKDMTEFHFGKKAADVPGESSGSSSG